jgi:hypothetical protein
MLQLLWCLDMAYVAGMLGALYWYIHGCADRRAKWLADPTLGWWCVIYVGCLVMLLWPTLLWPGQADELATGDKASIRGER